MPRRKIDARRDFILPARYSVTIKVVITAEPAGYRRQFSAADRRRHGEIAEAAVDVRRGLDLLLVHSVEVLQIGRKRQTTVC